MYGNLGGGDDASRAEASGVDANGAIGDDVLVAVGGAASLEGRAGDDVLVGGQLDDLTLHGGDGRDRVSGGAGDDVLYGFDGDRHEPYAGEVRAGDVLDGGEGRDRVDYIGRQRPVTVDLADRGTDGAAGEGDVLRGIENAFGGAGVDRIAGDEGPNRLHGGLYVTTRGDVLRGAAGATSSPGSVRGSTTAGRATTTCAATSPG